MLCSKIYKFKNLFITYSNSFRLLRFLKIEFKFNKYIAVGDLEYFANIMVVPELYFIFYSIISVFVKINTSRLFSLIFVREYN